MPPMYENINTSSLSFFKKTNLFLMHCVSVYPGTYEIANLPKMKKLMTLHKNVGYSDHIEGVESAKIAIGEGAKVIEKHFTIDNDLPGRDNKFAILPNELKDLTNFINNREMMLESTGMGYNSMEEDSRNNYAGRFDK